jgi:hypothetical protein
MPEGAAVVVAVAVVDAELALELGGEACRERAGEGGEGDGGEFSFGVRGEEGENFENVGTLLLLLVLVTADFDAMATVVVVVVVVAVVVLVEGCSCGGLVVFDDAAATVALLPLALGLVEG